MTVLIVTADPQLANRCEDALVIAAMRWSRATNHPTAEAALDAGPQRLILLDLGRGAIADPLGFCLLAGYRQPQTRILALLGNDLRPDGSLMGLCPTLAAYLPRSIAENDLAILAAHHATLAARPAPALAVAHPPLHVLQ